MVQNYLGWFRWVFDGQDSLGRFRMVQEDLEWFKMVKNGSNWIEMIQNGLKWFSMVGWMVYNG